VVQVNAVGKHAALAGQAVVVIHVQIALVLRPEIAHPGHFVGVFAQMGLHPGIGNSSLSRLTAASSSGDEVGAKRGVMA
jgi:hypothetical protein